MSFDRRLSHGEAAGYSWCGSGWRGDGGEERKPNRAARNSDHGEFRWAAHSVRATDRRQDILLGKRYAGAPTLSTGTLTLVSAGGTHGC